MTTESDYPRNTSRRVWYRAGVDLTLWFLAGLLAFPLRQPVEWTSSGPTVPLFLLGMLPVQLLVIWRYRLARQTWRTVTVLDLENLLRAVGIGTLVGLAYGFLLYEAHGFPRTVPLISGLLAIVFMGGVRLALRLRHERILRTRSRAERQQKRILLAGAGEAGALFARELARHPQAGLASVGFLDDDPAKQRLTIVGLPVLGRIDDMATICADHRIDEVLIAIPSVPGRTTRRIVELARSADVVCRILPGVTEILAGDVGLYRVRDVQVEDLLRRRPADLDFSRTGDYVRDATVMVTGAGGSIGSELVRQVARLQPDRVILFGQGENSLHTVAQDLKRDLPELDFVTVVGSVRDRAKLDHVMQAFVPGVVFHAAAHKHVPMMQSDPDEAVLNNIGGTRNIAEASLAAGVERFVNISTDKAVHPASVLGVTKNLAERLVLAAATGAKARQAFVSVRFGNVLGSRGSVIPVFQEQIRRGGPITITDPSATRYFMTIPEASRLVIQAGALGMNGAVYILDMGDPISIVDLANDMIRLSGHDEDEIAVDITGLRPGERLHEELFDEREHPKRTRFEQIMVGTASPPGPGFQGDIDALLKAAETRDMAAISASLADLVPGFVLPQTLHWNG